MLEILKFLKLFEPCPRDFKHWLDVNSQLENISDPIKIFLGIVDNYKDLPRQFNEAYINSLRGGKSVKDYIKNLFQTLRTYKYNGEYKYINKISSQISDEDVELIRRQFKYFALCLSNQINPDITGL